MVNRVEEAFRCLGAGIRNDIFRPDLSFAVDQQKRCVDRFDGCGMASRRGKSVPLRFYCLIKTAGAERIDAINVPNKKGPAGIDSQISHRRFGLRFFGKLEIKAV